MFFGLAPLLLDHQAATWLKCSRERTAWYKPWEFIVSWFLIEIGGINFASSHKRTLARKKILQSVRKRSRENCADPRTSKELGLFFRYSLARHNADAPIFQNHLRRVFPGVDSRQNRILASRFRQSTGTITAQQNLDAQEGTSDDAARYFPDQNNVTIALETIISWNG